LSRRRKQSNNGQRPYRSRVLVCTYDGRYLYRTHGEHAQWMVAIGAADPEPGNGGVKRILLRRLPLKFERIGPSLANLATHPGRRYWYRERLGPQGEYCGLWTYSLRRIDPLELAMIRSAALGQLV
jgi:hypothetical protein